MTEKVPLGGFDLDDAGSEVGEQARAVGPSDGCGEVEDGEVGQHLGGHWQSPGISSVGRP
jgi:hypothetical protein